VGISALAVSMRAGMTEDWWESAADLAMALVPVLVGAPVGTVLNLNVPSLPLHEILGLRWARVGGAGLIKAANDAWDSPNRPEMEGPAAAEAALAVIDGPPAEKGVITLNVGSPFPLGGDMGLADPGEDATLVALGYAALTALRGPSSDDEPALLQLLDEGLAGAIAPLGMAG